MYIKQRKLSQYQVEQKTFVARIILLIIFLTLFAKFWYEQIIKFDYYHNLALENIRDEVEIKAPRGIIVDRKNRIIAENRLNFILFINRKRSDNLDVSIKRIADLTGKSEKFFRSKIEKYRHIPKLRPIPLLKNLSLQEVIYLQSRPEMFSEFEIKVDPDRAYPYDNSASHLLGYMSEITEAELKMENNGPYRLGDEIGKSGIEKQYESYLKGKKGYQTVIKDNLGVIKEIVDIKKPTIGATIHLTIDFELQQYIEQIMNKNNYFGAVGVVDLKTGGLLSMVSNPGFFPQRFWQVYDTNDIHPAIKASFYDILTLSEIRLRTMLSYHYWTYFKAWETIQKENYSLHNKFLQGKYSPGSVFKIVMALAGLEEGEIYKHTTVSCNGVVKIYNRPFHCWQEWGHGTVNLSEALKDSCNVYFYHLGKKMEIDTIAKYADLLGFGHQTGVDMPNEGKGLVPTKAFVFKDNRRWFPGDTISISIGGGMLEVTPIQTLELISIVALRGKKPKLHLLDKIVQDGNVISRFKPEFDELPIKKKHFELVIDGLFRVVNDEGTAKTSKIKGISICGKTGTQQIISKENPNYKELVKQKRFMPHAWFVSFAPRKDPRYAMVVFIEHGGGAGSVAAPVAKQIYQKLFKNE